METHTIRFFRLLAAAVLMVGLGACASLPSRPQHSLNFDPPVQRPKDPSKVELKLSTGAQRLYVVEGDNVLLATPVSVGRPTSPTPHGRFTVRSKQPNRRRFSSPGAGYPMAYWIEFYNPAYGMHWGFLKSEPNTMGCVRIPLKASKKVFDLVRVGTPIHIARSQPWDETIGRNLPVLDDSALPNPPMSYMLSQQVFTDIQNGRLWKF